MRELILLINGPKMGDLYEEAIPKRDNYEKKLKKYNGHEISRISTKF